MEVIVIIGSLRDPKWIHLRKSLHNVNFIEISNDLIYTSWNSQYTKASSLLFDGKNMLPCTDSVVDRPWFLDLVRRWCSTVICDYSVYLAECRNFEAALIQFFSQYSIIKVFCLYGIAHHVWNNIVESSLSNLGIDSIKFYPLLDSDYSILLIGANELNRPFKLQNRCSDYDPNLSHIYDVLSGSLIKSRPKYTDNELKHGNYYIKNDKILLSSALTLAIRSIKVTVKSLLKKPYYQFSFSPLLYSSPYSFVNKVFNLASQSLYISAYKQISQPLCLDSLRGQLLLFAHFQPEATTSPEGGYTWNHLELIDKLKSKFPHLQIFYKEHPASSLAFDSSKSPTDVGLCRSIAYLNALQALGVKFLDLDASLTIENMKRFEIIPVTIGGTVALQSALNGHYAIYSGHPWYKYFVASLPLYQLDSLNADSFLQTMHDNTSEKPDILLTRFVESMEPFLVANFFGFGLGTPKSDRQSVSSRIKFLRAMVED